MSLLKNHRGRGENFGFVGIHFTRSDIPEVSHWRGLGLRKVLKDEILNDSTMSERMQNKHRKVGNILLAEDDPIVRSLSNRILEGAGYRITAVNDGLAAWHALNDGDFDLLVTDNDMPNLTGVQLVAKLRVNKVKLPIILASGSADFFSGEEYRWLEFSACLQKPFTPDELRAAVERVLGVTPVREMITCL